MNEEKIMIFSKILEEIRIAILEDNKLTEIFLKILRLILIPVKYLLVKSKM